MKFCVSEEIHHFDEKPKINSPQEFTPTITKLINDSPCINQELLSWLIMSEKWFILLE